MDQQAIDALRADIRGDVVEPTDEGYDDARRVYNAMIDKRPRAIVQVDDIADVINVVKFAKQHDVLLAVRGQGHNGAGLGTCDDGLVLDLGRMNGIRVDQSTSTVWAEGGCRQGDVDHAGHPFGLAVPAGLISTTGIGGLTLGGGHGYLTRKYGLTIDNLLEADVVLADGSLVTASEDENEDLFWGLRGGGGNFGVATSFRYQARPVSSIATGPMLWTPEQATEVFQWYREFMPGADEDIYAFALFKNTPPVPLFPEELHGKTVCGLWWVHLESLDALTAATAELRSQIPPLFEHCGEMPFPALQSAFDPLLPPGLQWYWKGDFFAELPDAAIAQHAEYGSKLPTALSLMHMYPIDGAANRVAQDATAFSYRDAKWSMVVAGIDPDPANAGPITEWAQAYWNALHPYSAGGAYVNFMMEEGVGRVEAAYRGNYERLAAIKAKYDPDNLFRTNWNIKPAS